MPTAELHQEMAAQITPEAVREQLEVILQDPVFRSSKRSVQFLRYVVEQTLDGSADQIKERTIGVEVFGRRPSYDTNVDHVVRTAAIELRKRLAIYYGDERHRSELRVGLVPGSYIPRFVLPTAAGVFGADHEIAVRPAEISPLLPESGSREPHDASAPIIPTLLDKPKLVNWNRRIGLGVTATLLLAAAVAVFTLRQGSAQDLFWKPVLDTPGFVLLAVGSASSGPPTPSSDDKSASVPIVHRATSPSVPLADTITIARVTASLESRGKHVIIRPEGSSSFSELRESPVVLIGAFNNEWSLRLTRQLRYSLALDPDAHLIYIKDARKPESRSWSWATDQSTERQGAAGGPPLEDYALISRIWNSETGRVVVVIGGLYTYGTEAAGEFITSPQLMQAISKSVALGDMHKNVQIVLSTRVTDGTAGPPQVVAVASE